MRVSKGKIKTVTLIHMESTSHEPLIIFGSFSYLFTKSHLFWIMSAFATTDATTDATQGETKTAATTPDVVETYLGDHLIVPYYVTPAGVIKRPDSLLARWRLIFSYLGPSLQDSRELRFLCRLFRDSLHSVVWTTFPHHKSRVRDAGPVGASDQCSGAEGSFKSTSCCLHFRWHALST